MRGQATDALIDDIRDALRIVIDPELGFNVVDLGLVYDIAVDSSTARITMTTTTRGCPATRYLQDGVQESASLVPGVDAVEVTLTYDPPWNPQMMSAEAKQHLGVGEDAGW